MSYICKYFEGEKKEVGTICSAMGQELNQSCSSRYQVQQKLLQMVTAGTSHKNMTSENNQQ